ncbi:MAG: leucine-rich repeat domain-containing protein, partial [archaeon]|nr:leucine-rich repeat domain-containing protein [archaeon]
MFSGTGNGRTSAVCYLKKAVLLLMLVLMVSAVSTLCESDDSDAAIMALGQGNTKGIDWVLDSDGVINLGSTASGLKTYSSWNDVPNAPSSFTVRIGSSVTMIPGEMFSLDHIRSVTFPATLKTIGEFAFAGTDLTSVTLPRTLDTVGAAAFAYCSDLSYVAINGAVDLGPGAFLGCEKVTQFFGTSGFIYGQTMYILGDILCAYAPGAPAKTVTVPSKVTRIADDTFAMCPNLENLVIPDGVTRIGEAALTLSPNLRSISFPDTLTHMDGLLSDRAFYGADGTKYGTGPSSYAGKLFLLDGNVYREKYSAEGFTDGMSCSIEPSEVRYFRFVAPSSGSYTFFSSGYLDTVFHLYDSLGNEIASNDDYNSKARNFCSTCTLVSGQAYYCKVNAYGSNWGMTNLYCKAGCSVGDAGSGVFYVLSADNTMYLAGNGIAGAPSSDVMWGVQRVVGLPGVDGIADEAFYDCDTLLEADLTYVHTVGKYAFSRCDKLTKATIGPDTYSVGDRAFELCKALNDLHIRGGDLGSMVFNGCSSLTYVLFDGDTAVIGSSCFYGCTALTNVVLPDTLVRIGDFAFEGTALGHVTLPDSVTTLGNAVFRDCSSLTSVVLDEGLYTIGTNAFRNTALTHLEIPASVGEIGTLAFGNTPLASISVHPDNAVYSSVKGVLYSKDGTDLVLYPSRYGYTGFTVPLTVDHIASYAFDHVPDMANVTITANVRTMDSFAFYECDYLRYVYFDEGVQTLGFYVFEGCDSIWRIEFPMSLQSINAYSFDGYTFRDIAGNTVSATAQKLAGVTFVGSGKVLTATGEMYHGTMITLVDGVMTVDGYGRFSVTDPAPRAFERKDEVKEIHIAGTINAVDAGTFVGFHNLTTLHISDKVSDLVYGFLDDCPKLSTFKVDDGGHYTVVDSLLYDKDVRVLVKVPFTADGYPRYYTLPDTVTEIAPYAAKGVASQFEVYSSAVLSTIGQEAFRDSGLMAIDLCEGLSDIGADAFRGCGDLRVFNVPTTLSTYHEAFTGMTFYDGLTYSKMSLSDILGHVFRSYSGRCYTIDGTQGDLSWNYTVRDRTLYIDGKGDIPDTVEGTNNYWSRVQTLTYNVIIGEGITGIGTYAFKDFDRIRDVSLPSTLKCISAWAFDRPVSHSIAFPSDMAYIDPQAFPFVFMDWNFDALPTCAEYMSGYRFTNVSGSLVREVADPCAVTLVTDVSAGTVYVGKGMPIRIADHVNDTCRTVWYTDSGRTVPLAEGTVATGDTTLYAKTVRVMDSGQIGDHVWYYLDEDCVITVSGYGDTYDYGSPYDVPMYSYTRIANKLVIEDGVTSIGDCLFDDFCSIVDLEIPYGVTRIGAHAFHDCVNLVNITVPSSVVSIGNGAFEGCARLAGIDVPKGLSGWGSDCLVGCVSFERFGGDYPYIVDGIYLGSKVGTLLAVATAKLDTVIVPEGTVRIASHFITNEDRVSKIVFPAGLEGGSDLFTYILLYDEYMSPVTDPAAMAGHTFVRTDGNVFVMKDHPDTCTVTYDIDGSLYSFAVGYGTVLEKPTFVPVKEAVGGTAYRFVMWTGAVFDRPVTG